MLSCLDLGDITALAEAEGQDDRRVSPSSQDVTDSGHGVGVYSLMGQLALARHGFPRFRASRELMVSTREKRGHSTPAWLLATQGKSRIMTFSSEGSVSYS